MEDDFFTPIKQTNNSNVGPEPVEVFFSPLSSSQKMITEETPVQGMKRELARSGARAGEVILGSPANMLEMMIRGLNWVAKKTPGGKPKTEEELQEFLSFTPTSSNIKKFHEKYTGEYLKPQTPAEEKSDEILSDVVSILNPIEIGTKGYKAYKAAKKGFDILKDVGKIVRNRLLIAGTGQIGEETAEFFGAEKDLASKIKFGSTFLASLVSKNGLRGVENYKDKLYDEARSLRPQNARFNAKTFEYELNKQEKNLMKGDPNAAYKREAKRLIDVARNKIQTGEVPVEELEKLKVDVNQSRSGLYTQQDLGKSGQKLAKKELDRLSQTLDRGLMKYGRSNPKWFEKFRDAQKTHGAIEESKKVANFIQRNAHLEKSGPGAIALEVLTGHPGAILPTLGAAGAGTVALKSGEIMTQIWKSPKLRSYYLNVLKGALNEDANFLNYNLNKLNEEYQKSFERPENKSAKQ